ncbi:Zinc-finger double domain containing protein [Pyrenophora tritici-repentis]|uniref:Zinc-finger double domain containing protein n=3 Tax=Pyrenophora tritici-repentis TaxID=45151 RepID=A0A922NJL3_9PLEO|nr:uncharacterized protein PTRG_03057 [Pyrenophora tritici-repentis Pt-1C-BFP]EDU45580.1 conserved hypothetical protein [Pyrenophora tritici-repentis Pt-1C-BFP]KAI1519079.1 Zinc-finger double domain containing protein [Pyrenophora tritici-repentis]KAI1672628.1 Zinc-finger double domain containing protein [Pyrenophora tritici-repentis]KAI1686658.1 Zinc-finger double domain containing protein [Pyrenophora tritici-repentis]
MDFNSMLCHICYSRFLDCCCLDTSQVTSEMPYIAPEMLLNDVDVDVNPDADSFAFDMSLFDRDETEALAPLYEYVHATYGQPINNESIQSMEANETKVQSTTIQTHIEDTYTPGDRLSARPSKPRRAAQRRQAPRDGGFACKADGCDKVFNRQCDLNRHQKTHMVEKPHVCSTCSKGFLYPKDLQRHERQHIDPLLVLNLYRCDHPTCTNLDGFSRKDNLLRHKRNQHQMSPVAA